jgi:hypothetical protein
MPKEQQAEKRKPHSAVAKNSMLHYLEDLFEGSVLFGEGAPLDARLTRGDPHSKVLLLTGSNASGKSFAIRVLAAWLNDSKPRVEPLQISMKYRTMQGMHRIFMYGALQDDTNSTGSVSMVALEGGIRTAKERETPCWLMLDEPDTGLSEDFGYAMGQYIAEYANSGLGPKCRGLVVVTHSRELVKGLRETLKQEPHFAHVGTPTLSLQEWLEGAHRRSMSELLGLSKKSVETYRKVQKVLNDRGAGD